jgi:hypothetical protein
MVVHFDTNKFTPIPSAQTVVSLTSMQVVYTAWAALNMLSRITTTTMPCGFLDSVHRPGY